MLSDMRTTGTRFNGYQEVQQPTSRQESLFFTVFAVLALCLLAYAFLTGTPMKYPDERDYVAIASSVVNGDGFTANGSPTAFRPPIWPLILAGFMQLGLPQSLLALVPSLLMVAAAGVASVLGMRISRTPFGAIAGIAVLIYPLNVYTAVRLYPQALATLLILLLWLFTLWSIECRAHTNSFKPLPYLGIGFVGALLALSVPTLAFTALAVALWAVWASGRQRVRATAYTFGALLIPIGVWTVRNTISMGSFIPLTTSNGLNLLLGNNGNSTASSGVDVDISEATQAARGMGEVQSDGFFRAQAIEWITNNPVDAVKLYVSKVLNYFAPYNQPVTAAEGSAAMRWIAIFSFILLVALVGLRIAMRRNLRLHPTERFFLGLFLVNAFVMGVYFTRTRFRQPLDSILLVEGAIGIAIALGIALSHRLNESERETTPD
jgi:hypothetical protein